MTLGAPKKVLVFLDGYRVPPIFRHCIIGITCSRHVSLIIYTCMYLDIWNIGISIMKLLSKLSKARLLTSLTFWSACRFSMVFWIMESIPRLMLRTQGVSLSAGHRDSIRPSWKENLSEFSSSCWLNFPDIADRIKFSGDSALRSWSCTFLTFKTRSHFERTSTWTLAVILIPDFPSDAPWMRVVVSTS